MSLPMVIGATGRLIPGAGVTTWQPRDLLVKDRRRVRIVLGFLGVLALSWLGAFSSPATSDLVTGVVILEVFTLVPAAYLTYRSHQYTALLRRADRATEEEQTAAAEIARKQSERLWHLRRVMEWLNDGATKEAASEAVRSLEQDLPVHAALVQRQMQLRSLLALTTDPLAHESLNTTLTSCTRQLTELDHGLDQLVAAVADVVEAAGEGETSIALRPLREAAERVDILADALRHLTVGDATNVGGGFSSATVSHPGTGPGAQEVTADAPMWHPPR